MNKAFIYKNFPLSSFVLCLLAWPVAAMEEDVQFSMRVRSAGHELNGNSGDAASVLLRVSHAANWRQDLSSFIEFDHVETFLEDKFSDGVRLNGQPLVLDSEGSDLNQAFLDLGYRDGLLRFGRQRINFDDQRFVGGIGFWQNEQTFDALQITHNLASASSLSYTYVANVNRIFGDEADKFLSPDDVLFDALNGRRPVGLLGDHALDTHLLRFEFNEWDYTRLVGYFYANDNKDRDAVSNNLLGLSYHFNYKVDHLRYRGRVEGAVQERTEVAPQSRIPYGLIELALGYNAFELLGRTELLGEDEGIAFVAPLGSGHEFSGWADKFLQIPEAGLIDKSLQLSWRSSPWRVSTRYHVFNEYQGGSRYGDELDVDVTYKLKDKHSLHLRYAYFREVEEFAARLPDSNKYFVTYSYNF